MSKDKAFEKFKLVPYNESQKTVKTSPRTLNISPGVLAKTQKYVRDYDPALRAKTNAFIGMRKAIFGRQSGWTARKRLDVLNSNMARYKHLASQAPLETQEQPVQEQQETPRLGMVNENVEVKPLNNEFEEEEKKPEDELKPLVTIPKSYQAKFHQMRSLSSKTIQHGQHGELVIRGVAVPNSAYGEVMRAMYVSPKGKGKTPLPVGLAEAVSELKRLGVSSNVLSATRARALYAKADTPAQTGSGRSIPRKRKTVMSAKSKKSAKILRLY